MKHLLVFLLVLLALDARAEGIKWSGKTGMRYSHREHDDGLNSKNGAGKNTSLTKEERLELRAAVGGSGKIGEVDWALALRTQSSTSIGSEYVFFNQAQDPSFGVELAYAKYSTEFLGGELAATLGRHKAVFQYDNVGQLLVDNDVRFDGLGWNWKKGDFSLAATQYVIGARNVGTFGASTYSHTEADNADPETRSGFGWLFSLQPSLKWKFSDEIEAIFSLGYFNWAGTGGKSTAGAFNNKIHGGKGTDNFSLDNARQWQISAGSSLPWKLRAQAEYVRNKKGYYGARNAQTGREGDNEAYSFNLTWNKVKSAGDWSVVYAFTKKGIASVAAKFSDGDIAPDLSGQSLGVTYGIAENVSASSRYYRFHELGKVDVNGLSTARNQSLMRLDFVLGMVF